MTNNPTPTNTPTSPMDELENKLDEIMEDLIVGHNFEYARDALLQLITSREQFIREESEKPVEYVYEGFTGCNNINPDICNCATHEDPICYYCEKEIEEGQEVLSTSRWGDPFSEDNAGWEHFTAHKVCPDDTNLKQLSEGEK